jgi:flagellar protein FliS
MIPHDEYLVNEVLTATPQRLHLMLIDAAIRHCERARRFWNAQLEEQASEAIAKAQDTVSEMLACLNYGQQRELAGRIAGVYNFVFRAVVNAGLKRDEKSLADALRILEIERDTWREIVRMTGSAGASASSGSRTHGAHGPPAPVAMPEALPTGFSAQA